MKQLACPSECGFIMRWYEDDFTDAELEQLMELGVKHLVRSHNYPDNEETRKMAKKEITTVEK